VTEGSAPDQPDRILLVDDNPTNLQVLYQTLDGRGYRLLIAKSGEQALSVCAKAKPAMILLDIMMPGIDGFETCARLKADPATADSAVIFLSALNEASDKVRGLELGAVDYIAKPFDAEEVIARVETHLKIRRLEHSLSRKNRELEAINQRMKLDLEAAARVQQSLLPSELPEHGRAHFAWRYRPCDELAGDCLNVFAFDDRYMGLYVVDVSGHGVSASLLAVTISHNLRVGGGLSLLTGPSEQAPGFTITNPSDVARRLNALYPMESPARLYFTLLYGILDTETGEFRFVSAGNPGPILAHTDGEVEIFDAPAVPIGLLPDSTYEDTVIQLQAGDRLCLHSDGLSEERNQEGEVLGGERMRNLISRNRDRKLEESLDALIDEAVRWRGSGQLHDDVAIVAAELLGD
jgi:sigma-B regulation protein RsbU (phosphoserine phosphatase)